MRWRGEVGKGRAPVAMSTTGSANPPTIRPRRSGLATGRCRCPDRYRPGGSCSLSAAASGDDPGAGAEPDTVVLQVLGERRAQPLVRAARGDGSSLFRVVRVHVKPWTRSRAAATSRASVKAMSANSAARRISRTDGGPRARTDPIRPEHHPPAPRPPGGIGGWRLPTRCAHGPARPSSPGAGQGAAPARCWRTPPRGRRRTACRTCSSPGRSAPAESGGSARRRARTWRCGLLPPRPAHGRARSRAPRRPSRPGRTCGVPGRPPGTTADVEDVVAGPDADRPAQCHVEQL
jgi:hypothetical protein